MGKYYSFDTKRYHFVVLKCNHHDPSSDREPGAAHFHGNEQLQRLEADLEKTKLPVIAFLHHAHLRYRKEVDQSYPNIEENSPL
ncbi:MAG TPA: hypothetical protein VFC34_12285 [Puia sp.]|nr:hypothetical protein [Puia sp.]